MGCSQIKSATVVPQEESKDARNNSRLMEKYEVGDILGEGAFGVVYACKHRKTQQEVAVKMVDKAETPFEKIKAEADILQFVEHPHIVKLHEVFFEKCFVCIVMDKYSGGDLIDGLHLHLHERGKISCYGLLHIAYQLTAAVHYLHSRQIVHRDVKGDNCLMDRKDITDPKCHMALTDFGTAVHLSPGQRLASEVGTKIFWPPEVYAHNYGLKFDIWSMGVTMYGLLDGRFPFKDGTEVCRPTKVLKYPLMHPDCEEYLKGMLRREEEKRYNSEEVLKCRWIRRHTDPILPDRKKVDSPTTSLTCGEQDSIMVESPMLPNAVPQSPHEEGKVAVRDAVNVGVRERRRELVERLGRAQERGRTTVKEGVTAEHFMAKWFTIADKRTKSLRRFEWWDDNRVQASSVLMMHGMSQLPDEPNDAIDRSPAIVGQMLQECNINIEKFGVGNAKTLDQLAAEVQIGAARLMLDASNYKKLVRVVDVVLLRLYSSSNDGKILVETAEQYPDGRRRETNRMPGAKKLPHETAKDTARRTLQEFLGMGDISVEFYFERREVYEEEFQSPSFPGVTTVYRKEIVQCYVSESRESELTRIGLPRCADWTAEEANHNMRYLSWMTEKQAQSKHVKLRAEGSEEVSALVMAPIGWLEDDLRGLLERSGVDVEKYGVDGAKTLKEFSMELIKGEASLMSAQDGSLVRLVDVVFLKMTDSSGRELLVQTELVNADGTKEMMEVAPTSTRRPDENQFHTAKRILRRHLRIDENRVQLNPDDSRYYQQQVNEQQYPGLVTVYRRRVISARLKRSLAE